MSLLDTFRALIAADSPKFAAIDRAYQEVLMARVDRIDLERMVIKAKQREAKALEALQEANRAAP